MEAMSIVYQCPGTAESGAGWIFVPLRCPPRCAEARPGVWIEEGARVHKEARLVAPVYLGASKSECIRVITPLP